MSRAHIITGLDIGTSSVKILSVAAKKSDEELEILSQHQEVSFGVRKGVVVDVPRVAEIIASLAEKNSRDCNRKITSVYASVDGGHIFCSSSHGLVSVSRADRKISEEDIERVLQNAQIFPLPGNKEIMQVFPLEYIVDGEKGIKEAVGLEGVRLETNIVTLCGFSPYLRNSSHAILNAGLQVSDLTFASLAAGRAVLTPREKELGVLLIDIGAGTTSLSIFEEGGLTHAAVLPVGSANITSDIAICLKTDIDIAEKIKLEFGRCETNRKPLKDEKKIKIEGEEPLLFSKKLLNEIVEARVEEIFEFAAKELKKVSRQGLLPGGVVLTGGGAKLPGIKDIAKRELKLPCRIGAPRNCPAVLEDPTYSVAYGLVLEGLETEVQAGKFSRVGQGISSRLKKMLKIFIP